MFNILFNISLFHILGDIFSPMFSVIFFSILIKIHFANIHFGKDSSLQNSLLFTSQCSPFGNIYIGHIYFSTLATFTSEKFIRAIFTSEIFT